MKKHKFELKWLQSAFTAERFKNIYQEILRISKALFLSLVKRDSETLEVCKNIPMTERKSVITKLVRKLENKNWLDPEVAKSQGINGTQADALKNFKTTTNDLSVYIADNEDLIPRILAAIAVGKDKPDVADYALFDTTILDKHSIVYEKCSGSTADSEVNLLHIDLKRLTALQVCFLAQDIQDGNNLKRVSKKSIEKAIKDGINSNFLDKAKINTTMLNNISNLQQSEGDSQTK